jgi:hypothetical protein
MLSEAQRSVVCRVPLMQVSKPKKYLSCHAIRRLRCSSEKINIAGGKKATTTNSDGLRSVNLDPRKPFE